MTLSDEVIQFRARHNLTQEELAALVGFTRQTILNIESGKSVRRTTEVKVRAVMDMFKSKRVPKK